jgi:Ca2+-binding EF-hand superfamily protein
MKLPNLIVCSLLIAPFAMAQSGPQQNGKSFGDGTGLPMYLAHYDVKGPNGQPDGVIDEEERQVMIQARDQMRKHLREDFDTDGDGHIDDPEREHARLRLRQMIDQNRVERFNEADADDDGLLSPEEFLTLPGIANKVETDPGLVDAIFARLNADEDEFISEEEFLVAVRQCDQDRDGSGPGSHDHDGMGGGGMGGDGMGGS